MQLTIRNKCQIAELYTAKSWLSIHPKNPNWLKLHQNLHRFCLLQVTGLHIKEETSENLKGVSRVTSYFCLILAFSWNEMTWSLCIYLKRIGYIWPCESLCCILTKETSFFTSKGTGGEKIVYKIYEELFSRQGILSLDRN